MRLNLFLSFVSLFFLAIIASGAGDRSEEILQNMDNLLRGVESSSGEYTMTIAKERWKKPRLLKMKTWEVRKTDQRPGKNLIIITEPANEAGKGFLKIGNEMWGYFPEVKTTTKIPRSMMFEGWMGSDFTNDDLMRQGSAVNDYSHRTIGSRAENGQTVLTIELVPKAEALETWGKIVIELRESDSLPLKQEFYNAKGKLVRTMIFSDIKTFGDRTLPSKWIMKPANKPNDSTTFIIDTIQFNVTISDDVFTLENLKRGGK